MTMDSSGSQSQDKQSVPKFSSFKVPSRPSGADRPTEPRNPERRHQEDRKSRRCNHRHIDDRSRSPLRSERRERHRSPGKRPRSQSPRRAASRDRRISRERIRSSEPRSKYPREQDNIFARTGNGGLATPDDSTADLFTIDLKGDRHNLTYGTTHRYAVPKYRRSGRGQVLGADEKYRIDREHVESDSLVLRIKDSSFSYPFKSVRPLSKRVHPPKQFLRVKTEDNLHSAADLEQDFIPFDTKLQNGSGGRADDDDSGDEHHAYRSIHGKAKGDGIPRDMELVEEGRNQEDGASEERKTRHAELSRAVNSNPTDVAAWLRLIDYQDILIIGPNEDSRPLTYNEQQSVADVKLSLYEKAIKQSTNNPHKDRLLLGRLQEGAHLWNSKKLLVQWNKTLREHSECISLWVSYLNFRQTDFQNFDFEQLMTTFSECLNLNTSSSSHTAKHQVQCYLFLRMTLFLREAGYLELAVGLWQALLEFTYFKSESKSQELQKNDPFASFRDYWEEELPRIGEDGSSGWRGWVDSPSNKIHVSASHEYQNRLELPFLMRSWGNAENERALASLLPSRTLDQLKSTHAVDGNEQYVDDPYSVVLFSDFDHILRLSWDSETSDEVIDSFLYFCHLPHLTRPHNIQTTRLWSGDNFLRNELIAYMEPGLSRWTPALTETESSISPLRFPIPNFLHTTCTFFPSQNAWFDSFASWRQNYQPPESSVIDREWVQLTLRSLVERGRPREGFDDELAEYTLGLMFSWAPKRAKKYAKGLLKKWTSSLRVCNALALMEWRTDSPGAAVQVWSSSISWGRKLSADSSIDSAILWSSWAWELFQQGETSRASYVLHAIPVQSIDKDVYSNIKSEDMVSNPTSTLQVQSYLHEYQARALGYRRPHSFVAYTDCLALLLFIEEYPIRTVLDVYSSAALKSNDLSIEDQNLRSYITELLHQARAKLLFFHHRTKTSQLTPLEIRDILQESISLFPDNTIFLSLHIWNESRFNLLDRIRNVHLLTKSPENRYILDSNSVLTVTAMQSAPITTHLLSIWSELCRPTWAGSTHHSARASFERALGENANPDSLKPGDKHMRSSFGTDSARTNLMIWKLYILFEIHHTRDIGAAKAVFYRAIRACPWSKQLFMLAFEYLQDDIIRPIIPENSKTTGFRFADLRQLYHAMTEKQLRIHVNIEDEIREAKEDLEEDRQTRSGEVFPP